MSDLSIVILSFNRKAALLRTLSELSSDPIAREAELIVVDNASVDGSADAIAAAHPSVTLRSLKTNVGVAGFNRGVEVASRGRVLILDDDAWPDPASLAGAMRLLDERADTHAVSFHPVHPVSRTSEWPMLRAKQDAWPVMGCGNLVRTDAWRTVGGYEEAFFLYRNDTDLALKLLGSGMNVHADPDWIVWHDSPAAARKSERWLHLATRNWCWMCRRHGKGLAKLAAMSLGVGWAVMQAGFSASRIVRVFRGAVQGVSGGCPMPAHRGDGSGIRQLLRIRFSRP